MKRSVVVGALGTAQTLAWGSSYYLPAILADPIAQGLGLSRTTIFGLFSGALLLSAVLGPSVGRAIDNHGGRGILALSNLVLATGLVLLGVAQGFVTLAVAWAVLGVGMAMGLYDPAFATLTGLYGRAARGPITGITLIAGFASTVGWPLSAFLDAQFGWREACLIWAALQCDRAAVEPVADPAHAASGPYVREWERLHRRRAARWLSLPSCLRRPGLSPAPWRRICRASSKSPAPARRRRLRPPPWSDRRRLRRGLWNLGRYVTVHPLVSARLAALLHPIGAVILGLLGPGAITAFAVLHGAGNGLLTIAKGTVPLAIFGPVGYGLRSGILGAPARATQAASPLLFGLLMDEMGIGVLAISAGLSLSALFALLLLKARPAAAPVPA